MYENRANCVLCDFSAANESAMLQLQAVKHPESNQANAHFFSPPPKRGATAIASNADAIEPAPECLRENNLGLS